MKELIQEIYDLRLEIAEVKRKSLKPLEDRKRELEEDIITQLDELEISKSGVPGVNVSISEKDIPQSEGDPDSWDKFYKFVEENNCHELLMKSCNNAAYRDALDIYGEIPGIKSFTRRTLSVTKAA